MGLQLPSPRLLPLTIAAMTVLAAVKIGVLTGLVPADSGDGLVAPALVFPARAEAAPSPAPTAAVGPSPASGAMPVAATSLVPAPPPAPTISDTEMGLLQDLRARRGELDARQAALDARQAVLDASEKRLAARVDELTALQTRLEALEASRKQREEANWTGLVKVYETMKPRDAAVIFNDLEMPVLLQILDRMKDAKAAPVLASMQADRAREATTKLADMRLRETKMGAAAPGG